MFRTVWFALICLSSLGILFALRASVGLRSTPEATASAGLELSPNADDVPQNADQQASAPVDDGEAKLTTRTVEIIATDPDPTVGPKASDAIVSPPDTNETMSWHWHEGSKIIKRTSATGQRKSKPAQAEVTGVPEVIRQPRAGRPHHEVVGREAVNHGRRSQD
jgi:hypothetical protein